MTYTEQCVPLIRHIHCAMEKEANNKLREMDLTVSQIYLLQALNHAPDGTHTLTLKALEKRGYYQRARDGDKIIWVKIGEDK